MWKKGIDRKNKKNRVLGTTFLAKSTILNDFGVPGASPGEALGRILGDKFRSEKNDEKKEVKGIASAGDADPGQDPPAGFFRKIRHAFAPPGAGERADSMCCAQTAARGSSYAACSHAW